MTSNNQSQITKKVKDLFCVKKQTITTIILKMSELQEEQPQQQDMLPTQVLQDGQDGQSMDVEDEEEDKSVAKETSTVTTMTGKKPSKHDIVDVTCDKYRCSKCLIWHNSVIGLRLHQAYICLEFARLFKAYGPSDGHTCPIPGCTVRRFKHKKSCREHISKRHPVEYAECIKGLVLPEKRKRGEPKKVVLMEVDSSDEDNSSSDNESNTRKKMKMMPMSIPYPAVNMANKMMIPPPPPTHPNNFIVPAQVHPMIPFNSEAPLKVPASGKMETYMVLLQPTCTYPHLIQAGITITSVSPHNPAFVGVKALGGRVESLEANMMLTICNKQAL
jgi:hypothetical protein